MPLLRGNGIIRLLSGDLSSEQHTHLEECIMEHVFPVLSPMAMEEGMLP